MRRAVDLSARATRSIRLNQWTASLVVAGRKPQEIEGGRQMRRWRRRDSQRLAVAARQGDAAGMQMKPTGDLAPRQSSGLAAIFAVAQDRRAQGRAMRAQLVGAAGQ